MSIGENLGAYAMALDAFEEQIAQVERALVAGVRGSGLKSDHTLLVEQAEWHARGTIYHCREIYRLYSDVVRGVAMRTGESPDGIVMHTREMQELLFEFYALTSLCRITLDQLKRYVAPTFVTKDLPNSVNDMLKGTTDCPLYATFLPEQSKLMRYLIDVRDCMVHHRSFGTSDNTVAVRDGAPDDVVETLLQWKHALTRVVFRQVDGGISVNVLLPDAIYGYDSDGNRGAMLRPFTYGERVNLLSQSREFTRLIVAAVLAALDVLGSQRSPVYTWEKVKRSP